MAASTQMSHSEWPSVPKRPVGSSLAWTERTLSLRPLDGTEAQLQSVLTSARDGRPGPIGLLVYVSFSDFMSIR